MKKKEKQLGVIIIAIVALLVFPILLNWILQQNAIVPVVGDGTTWLAFWPVYLSAVASFGMIYFTYKSLQQNKKQLEQMRIQREEEERARLVFSVIVYQQAFMLKISNIGKRNVYNAVINFNEDFLNELKEERFRVAFRQLSSPFFIEAGMSRHLFLGFCEEVNKTWKDKNVIIKMKGRYNDSFPIDEELDMNFFMDKTFVLVQGDLETTMSYIKKGLIVQNNSYMPVQKSLDQIAKSLNKLESSFEGFSGYLKKVTDQSEEADDYPQEPMFENKEQTLEEKETVTSETE